MSLHKRLTPNIEHLNISVSNPDKTAQLLCNLFDWKIRWSGESMDDGYTVHVGSSDSYLALYSNKHMSPKQQYSHNAVNNLNHIGVVVDDLISYETKARSLVLKPNNHRDYGHCNSFYVVDESDLEIEIICYV